MLTLAFDTSSKTASVSLLQDHAVLYDVVINTGSNHSEILLPAIDDACRQTRMGICEIDLFACTCGPGSFTGLRIGVSTLKGLILATAKPAVSVSSLAALAYNAGNSAKIICSVMDAGRGQVYTACFKYRAGFLKQITQEEAIDPKEIKVHIDEDVLFVGDGAIKYADVIGKKHKLSAAKEQLQYVRASSVGQLALEKFANNDLVDITNFVPCYLRSADALPKKSIFEFSINE